MRFKKGTMVEVLSSREVPSGAWRTAEIISGNGHYYTVRYESYAGTGADKERVPRKIIRPLPPPVEVEECWAPGDIVEVFKSYSWKMAVVAKVLEGDCFLVRLLGSSLEIRATHFDIRVRQSWQNDEWITIGQSSKGGNEGQHNHILSLRWKARLSSQTRIRNLRKKLIPKGDMISLESKVNIADFNFRSSKGLRKHPHSLVEPHGRISQKIRAVEKDGRLSRTSTAYPSKLLEQVDDILFLGKTVHERYKNGSAEYQTGSFLYVEAEKKKDIGTSECLMAKGVEEEAERDSVASSVGSCSSGTGVFLPIEDVEESTTSDAESFCCSESHRKIIRRRKRSAAELHKLELDAYRCTIERLHASGPLTWEQEAWITNLRLTFNISNDEHLMQIRNLVSADNSTTFR